MPGFKGLGHLGLFRAFRGVALCLMNTNARLPAISLAAEAPGQASLRSPQAKPSALSTEDLRLGLATEGSGVQENKSKPYGGFANLREPEKRLPNGRIPLS